MNRELTNAGLQLIIESILLTLDLPYPNNTIPNNNCSNQFYR